MPTEEVEKGKLYIVATPIGNSRDISPRAVEILENVDFVAAEDTRRTIILFNKLGIRNTLLSNHKFNEYKKAKYFIDDLLQGKSVAIVTDAGTPCISDPGNELIKEAIENGIDVMAVPGCCAAVAALSVSGFDLSTFTFIGFFPRENAEKKKALDRLAKSTDVRTFVFYESPLRIMSTVEYFIDYGLDCRLCLCNDLTKKYEHAYRGTPAEVKEQLLDKGTYEKGEYVLVVEVSKETVKSKPVQPISAEALLADVLVSQKCTLSDAIKTVLADENNSYSKNELKNAGIKLKDCFMELWG